jgi:hypothetical protein
MTETSTPQAPAAAPPAAAAPTAPPAAPSTPAAEPQGRAADRYQQYQVDRNSREAGTEPPQQQPAEPPKAGDGGAEINELRAFKAAQESKALSRPQSADAYKAELPADFKPPEGLNYQFSADDPLLSQAKASAFEAGIDQENFSKLLGLYAGSQVANQQTITTARNAEVAKLGATGPARIDALTTYFKAQLGGAEGAQFMSRVFTASDVQIAEKIMTRMQGTSSGSNFKQGGREPPEMLGRASPERVAAMSPAERLNYSKMFDQRSMPEWRDPRG